MLPPWSDEEHHDVVIVGAGVAGLFVAHSLLGDEEDAVVLEASDRPGGRIRTVYDDDGRTAYEAGPWRVPETHERARRLFRRFGVDLVPSRTAPLAPSHAESKTAAGLTTWDVSALRHKSVHAADRADVATGYADETHSASGSAPYASTATRYLVAPEGFSTLAQRMAAPLSVVYECRVVDVRRRGPSSYALTCACRRGHNDFFTRELVCARLFVCVPPHAFREWDIFRRHAKSLACAVEAGELHHIYARSVGRRGGAGRPPSKHSVSPLLSQTIPSQYPASAWFQASYSGGRVARMWHHFRMAFPDGFLAAIRNEVRRWSGAAVDETASHYWPAAYHAWRAVPHFDLARSVARSVYANVVRLPNVLVAGEAFSSHQAWIEGALETAELALAAHRRPWPAAAPGDAVVDGWPLALRDWARVHPGGEGAILNHLGEDLSDLLRHLGHSDHAWAVVHSMKTMPTVAA